jgi:tetratricopeptide (TPR) repeat protein
LYLSGILVIWLVDLGFRPETVVYLKTVLAWGVLALVFGVCLGALDDERPIQLAMYCAAISVIVYLFLCAIGVYSADILKEFARDADDVLVRLVAPVLALALFVPIGAAVTVAIRFRMAGSSKKTQVNLTRISAGDFWQSLFPVGHRRVSLLVILACLFVIAGNFHVSRLYYREAIGFSNDKLLDKAMSAYQFYLSIWPFDDQAHLALGHVYRDLGRNEDALKEWRKAEGLNPLSAAWSLHSYFRSEKQFRAALLEAKRLGRDDEMMEAYLAIAKGYEEAKDFENAVSTLREALSTEYRSPQSWDLWMRELLAWDLYKLGRFNEQVAELEQVVKLSPDDPELWIALATAYVNNRQFQEALKSLKLADEIIAKNASSPYGTDVPPRFPPGFKFIQLARIHSSTNEHPIAIEYLKRAVNENCSCSDLIESEKDFESLRGSKEYQTLLQSTTRKSGREN